MRTLLVAMSLGVTSPQIAPFLISTGDVVSSVMDDMREIRTVVVLLYCWSPSGW